MWTPFKLFKKEGVQGAQKAPKSNDISLAKHTIKTAITLAMIFLVYTMVITFHPIVLWDER